VTTYSNLAHIPEGIGITLIGVGLYKLGVPVSYICATGAWLSMFTRDEAKEEYTYIEAAGGLRANVKNLTAKALAFWRWGKHNLIETALCFVAAYATATAIFLGLHL
jgi:hypothetical protein